MLRETTELASVKPRSPAASAALVPDVTLLGMDHPNHGDPASRAWHVAQTVVGPSHTRVADVDTGSATELAKAILLACIEPKPAASEAPVDGDVLVQDRL